MKSKLKKTDKRGRSLGGDCSGNQIGGENHSQGTGRICGSLSWQETLTRTSEASWGWSQINTLSHGHHNGRTWFWAGEEEVKVTTLWIIEQMSWNLSMRAKKTNERAQKCNATTTHFALTGLWEILITTNWRTNLFTNRANQGPWLVVLLTVHSLPRRKGRDPLSMSFDQEQKVKGDISVVEDQKRHLVFNDVNECMCEIILVLDAQGGRISTKSEITKQSWIELHFKRKKPPTDVSVSSLGKIFTLVVVFNKPESWTHSHTSNPGECRTTTDLTTENVTLVLKSTPDTFKAWTSSNRRLLLLLCTIYRRPHGAPVHPSIHLCVLW